MATLKDPTTEDTAKEWEITLPANDLLECFVSGLDDLILKIAVANASKRQRVASRGIRIESADIEAASNLVLDQILSQSDLPEDLKAEIRESQACLKENCRLLAK